MGLVDFLNVALLQFCGLLRPGVSCFRGFRVATLGHQGVGNVEGSSEEGVSLFSGSLSFVILCHDQDLDY